MPTENNRRLDLAAIRKRLEGQTGRRYWRSLDELAETPEFKSFVDDEFPARSSLLELDRRNFLKVMGASMALAGLAGCRRLPQEKIVPFVKAPEEMVPGKPLTYATAATRGGYGVGVLVESHEGRPIKLEGNPLHPANLGSSDIFTQAEILNFYDPDRATAVTHLGQPATYAAFLKELRESLAKNKGAGLRVLTESVSSPTLVQQIERLIGQYPDARWHQYEPLHRDGAVEGARLAFGEDVHTVLRLDKARVVFSLDADLFGLPGCGGRHAKDFMAGRRVGEGPMNRLYAVESGPSTTGATADHRLALRAGEIEAAAKALAAALGVPEAAGATAPSGIPAGWLEAAAADLRANAGAAVVVAGDEQGPAVHALAHAMNVALGAIGGPVLIVEPVLARPANMTDSLRDLVGAMDAGRVDTLLILGGNPAFDAPADVPFGASLGNVRLTVHLSAYDNETSVLCQWLVPEAHFLEAWGDVRAYDGTVSIVQPLIEPLFEGKCAVELIAAILGKAQPGYELVKARWSAALGGEKGWRRALHEGVVPDTAAAAKAVALRPDFLAGAPTHSGGSGVEVVLRPDPTIGDGRHANNGWLQELPKPFSKLTWENAAYMSVKTAETLGVEREEYIEIEKGGRKVKAPVWLQPGHPDDSITLHLGYGRTRAGQVGTDPAKGFDANALRTADEPWVLAGAKVAKVGGKAKLATTQHHHNMEGRDIVRAGAVGDLAENPSLGPDTDVEDPGDITLYHDAPMDYSKGNQWAMTIDLSHCTGCNACVVACQAENNIPVVGKEQVMRGRIMQWIRIDAYYADELDNPEVNFQPVTCMHCESAPCEPVCPVGATVHSHEGLNQMVYNRCVGTRYCSNNCPYKVRRFNFFNFTDNQLQFKQEERIPLLRMLNNPDVTVRGRGVMEKCTYCVQRINAARIEAKKDERAIEDGEIVTACEQACPTGAIVFGDKNDPNSRVSRKRADKRTYRLLEELNTRPRTTYLGKVRNPNPEIGAN